MLDVQGEAAASGDVERVAQRQPIRGGRRRRERRRGESERMDCWWRGCSAVRHPASLSFAWQNCVPARPRWTVKCPVRFRRFAAALPRVPRRSKKLPPPKNTCPARPAEEPGKRVQAPPASRTSGRPLFEQAHRRCLLPEAYNTRGRAIGRRVTASIAVYPPARESSRLRRFRAAAPPKKSHKPPIDSAWGIPGVCNAVHPLAVRKRCRRRVGLLIVVD